MVEGQSGWRDVTGFDAVAVGHAARGELQQRQRRAVSTDTAVMCRYPIQELDERRSCVWRGVVPQNEGRQQPQHIGQVAGRTEGDQRETVREHASQQAGSFVVELPEEVAVWEAQFGEAERHAREVGEVEGGGQRLQGLRQGEQQLVVPQIHRPPHMDQLCDDFGVVVNALGLQDGYECVGDATESPPLLTKHRPQSSQC
mmetsp:Transcript_38472/g.110001  ORF Transcript_38472/g.110001 Transcript_38472/m.110001 type:complete len:200 (-) Transcript_38472:150-749(-)